MKGVLALALLPILAAGPVWCGEGTPEAEAKVPAHTPEWTNPRQGDPGRTADEPAAEPAAGVRIAPTQTKVSEGAAPATAADDAGAVRFGDGKRGSRLPARRKAPVATEGDPDRPVITGSVPNDGRQEATHVNPQQDDGG